MSYCWITDIHLDFLSRDLVRKREFYDTLMPYSAILISGDIANSKSVYELLVEMYEHCLIPIYFVLGNHDYYGTNVESLRTKMCEIHDDKRTDGNVIYLTDSPTFIKLMDNTYVCGVDGWADARAGDFVNSKVRLNDSNYIEDLSIANRFLGADGLSQKMLDLSMSDTYVLNVFIEQIIENFPDTEEIIVVTHVPPFPECCLYNNRRSGDDFLPFFCNLNLGEMLFTKAILYPTVQFTVLCGHTHGKCDPYNKLPNLKIRVGGAEYYRPEIAGEIE